MKKVELEQIYKLYAKKAQDQDLLQNIDKQYMSFEELREFLSI